MRPFPGAAARWLSRPPCAHALAFGVAGAPGTAEVLGTAAAGWACPPRLGRAAQAGLHAPFIFALQPSILCVFPDNSSGRSAVLISGPRNLKCSLHFCPPRGCCHYNIKLEVVLVSAPELLEEREGCGTSRLPGWAQSTWHWVESEAPVVWRAWEVSSGREAEGEGMEGGPLCGCLVSLGSGRRHIPPPGLLAALPTPR